MFDYFHLGTESTAVFFLSPSSPSERKLQGECGHRRHRIFGEGGHHVCGCLGILNRFHKDLGDVGQYPWIRRALWCISGWHGFLIITSVLTQGAQFQGPCRMGSLACALNITFFFEAEPLVRVLPLVLPLELIGDLRMQCSVRDQHLKVKIPPN